MDRSQVFGEQLDSLLSISTEIASVRELADVQDRALAHCLELTSSEFGFIGLLDESGENVLVAAIKGVEATTPGFVERNRFMSVRPSVFGIVCRDDGYQPDPDSVRDGRPTRHDFTARDTRPCVSRRARLPRIPTWGSRTAIRLTARRRGRTFAR